MNGQSRKRIVRVAVATPLRQSFDYGYTGDAVLRQGMRVLVPFGRQQKLGIIEAIDVEISVDLSKLKNIKQIIDDKPLLPEELLQLCRWASQYYHHPLGEVYQAAVPVIFRSNRHIDQHQERFWQLTDSGKQAQIPANAHRMQALWQLLQGTPKGVSESQLAEALPGWRDSLKRMQAKNWITSHVPEPELQTDQVTREAGLSLNPAQQVAVDTLLAHKGGFASFLLFGVTGSGKTEVYLQVIEKVLQQGGQVLILVPEIGLTPQLLQRFSCRFQVPMAVFHSSLSDVERGQNWLKARSGEVRIVIGTRSAVFTALAEPGLIIIDEEHDPSFKQQDGFRYSARDLAIVRARKAGIPVLLGSATPSMESMQNALDGRYTLLALPERAGQAVHPEIRLIDVRQQKLEQGLSAVLLQHIDRHIKQGGQVLLFLNRRGYAPTLLCHDCGWVAHCHRCDAHMTLHQASRQLRCHHCGSERRVDSHCEACGSADLRPIGLGTERVEQALKGHFPQVRIARIDRDTTRRKGEMEQRLKDAESGRDQILLGTQLLAKGHHFPGVTLVAILDSDQGLFSADFRGAERTAQLVLQVSGRAGRAERPGEVIIQTWHPDHELFHYITRQDYQSLAQYLLRERSQMGWPPYSHLALLRAEASHRGQPHDFLNAAVEQAAALAASGQVSLLGPVAAPMEKRAGRYRAQLLVQANGRAELHAFIQPWLEQIGTLKLARQVRWSLDIDPQDMF